MTIKPRGKGKYTGCYGIKSIYKFYKKTYNTNIDYKQFVEIIKACNEELIKVITENAEIVELPYRLGKIQISKFERSYNQPKNKWKIDWKKSNELGIRVYHDQPFIYKWTWKKHHSIVKNKTGYKFIAARDSARTVPRLLATKKYDYFK